MTTPVEKAWEAGKAAEKAVTKAAAEAGTKVTQAALKAAFDKAYYDTLTAAHNEAK